MVKALLRLLCRILFRIEVHGDPSVLENPRTLVIANHESFLDGPLLALFLPLESTFVVHCQMCCESALSLRSSAACDTSRWTRRTLSRSRRHPDHRIRAVRR